MRLLAVFVRAYLVVAIVDNASRHATNSCMRAWESARTRLGLRPGAQGAALDAALRGSLWERWIRYFWWVRLRAQSAGLGAGTGFA
ncbi:hypothetical protein CEJ45_10335 [Herbaspirillum aquaticum]|uniref:Uncharacterized protein n=1 Tax=Herbaspirillum aquaticum TaxID=568783 RepID=A0A225STW8_9BURK|nr:hypothetical protein CEJ45_10335 [Herbaspirillum aquaticum]